MVCRIRPRARRNSTPAKAAGLLVQFPGWQYPAVINTTTGTISYDNFGGMGRTVLVGDGKLTIMTMAATGTDGRPENGQISLGPNLSPRRAFSGHFETQAETETGLNDGRLSTRKTLEKTEGNAILTGYLQAAGPRGGMVDTGDLKSPGGKLPCRFESGRG